MFILFPPLLFYDRFTLLQLLEVAAGWCTDVERGACYVLTCVVRGENNKHVGGFFCGYKHCLVIFKTQPQNLYLAFWDCFLKDGTDLTVC